MSLNFLHNFHRNKSLFDKNNIYQFKVIYYGYASGNNRIIKTLALHRFNIAIYSLILFIDFIYIRNLI
jgi:hypothetical protein